MKGGDVYVKSPLSLNLYSADVTMVSGGISTDMDSVLNVPPDYLTFVTEYLKQQLGFERQQPQEITNDGIDAITAV